MSLALLPTVVLTVPGHEAYPADAHGADPYLVEHLSRTLQRHECGARLTDCRDAAVITTTIHGPGLPGDGQVDVRIVPSAQAADLVGVLVDRLTEAGYGVELDVLDGWILQRKRATARRRLFIAGPLFARQGA